METQSKKKLVYGMLLVFGMHIILFGIIFALSIILSPMFSGYNNFFILLFPVIFIAVTQLIYLLPVIFMLKRKQEFDMMKGAIVGAVITALLNGGCWLMIGVSRL